MKRAALYGRLGSWNLGVIRLNDIQQEALLGDTELLEGLIEVAGIQGRTIEVHNTTGVINTVRLKAGTQSGVLVDDDSLTLDIVADSNLNHYVFSFYSFLILEKWWGGIAAPLRCLLLSDGDVAHDLGLLGRNLIENSGELLLQLVQVDDGATDTVGNPFLDVAGGGGRRIEAAELILAVFNSAEPLTDDDIKLINGIKNRSAIIILNKSDLESKIDRGAFNGFRTVETAAKSNRGHRELLREITDISGTASLDPDSAVLMNERQRACAVRALDGVTEAVNAINSGCTLDAVGVCVDDALAALLELTGRRVTNEVSDEIFRKFCVGK